MKHLLQVIGHIQSVYLVFRFSTDTLLLKMCREKAIKLHEAFLTSSMTYTGRVRGVAEK